MTIRSERPWWGNPLVWLAVSAVLLVLGLFVLPHFLPGVLVVLPFIRVGGWGRRRRNGSSSGPSVDRQTRQTNV